MGHYLGDTPCEEKRASYWNRDPGWMENRRAVGDRNCRQNSQVCTPFLVGRIAERGAESPLGPALEPLKSPLGITPDPSALLVPIPAVSCLPRPRGDPEISRSIPVPPPVPPGRAWS